MTVRTPARRSAAAFRRLVELGLVPRPLLPQGPPDFPVSRPRVREVGIEPAKVLQPNRVLLAARDRRDGAVVPPVPKPAAIRDEDGLRQVELREERLIVEEAGEPLLEATDPLEHAPPDHEVRRP